MTISLSVITATNPVRLSKGFELTPDGSLKKLSGGVLIRGHVKRVDVAGPVELAELIKGLEPAQALCFGVPTHDGEIVPQDALAKHPGAVSRTREHFRWPDGPGIMLLDYDPPAGATPLSFTDLLVALTQALPELASAPLVGVPSASSFVYRSDGTELRGAGGWHVFVSVETAADIPAVGETLSNRLWLAGHGRILVSKCGAALLRTLIDTSVFQPERLSFDAGAACGPGLVQKRLEHLVIRNPDAAPMPTPKGLTQAELADVRKLQKAAKEQAAPEIRAAEELWLDERVEAAIKKNPHIEPETIRENLKRSLANHELLGDFELTSKGGQVLTVAELLDNPKKYHGMEFHDPLEPTYGGNDPRIAVARLLGNRPNIYSHAHGGIYYKLLRQTRSLTLIDGQYPQALQTIADRLGAEKLAFDFGGALVTVSDGRIVPLRTAGVAHLCEKTFSFMKLDVRAGEYRPSQMPTELAGRLLEARDCWGNIPKLVGITTHPTITSSGRVISKDGFDTETGLLMVSGRDWDIPTAPTRAQVAEAVATLWRPLSLMPFETPADAGAAMSLLLTAVARPALDLAPLFITASPTYGSGKTLLAVVAALLAGADGSVTGISQEENEQAKALLALLLAGTPAVILDNLSGEVRGDQLAAMLTSPVFRGRILGQSQIVEAPTRILWVASGINLSPNADLQRRSLTIRLDPAVENPAERVFDFHPVTLTKQTLPEMQTAALTVLKAAHVAGAWDKQTGQAVGSFEQWDRMIRRSVLWLISEGLAPCDMADPILVQARERSMDGEAGQLETLLHAWRSLLGQQPIGASALLQYVADRPGDPDATEIQRIALEVAGVGGRVSVKRWGRFLARSRGRVVDGLRLEQPTIVHGQRQWKVALVAKVADFTLLRGNVKGQGDFNDISKNGAEQSPQSHQTPPYSDYESCKWGEV